MAGRTLGVLASLRYEACWVAVRMRKWEMPRGPEMSTKSLSWLRLDSWRTDLTLIRNNPQSHCSLSGPLSCCYCKRHACFANASWHGQPIANMFMLSSREDETGIGGREMPPWYLCLSIPSSFWQCWAPSFCANLLLDSSEMSAIEDSIGIWYDLAFLVQFKFLEATLVWLADLWLGKQEFLTV